jgi:glycosyltransferase involved in cell wall biosynthesis
VTTTSQSPIRVMRIIARMNVGGPAVQVSGLMRGINDIEFDQCLFTGFCGIEEIDYLETVATDIQAIRIPGFGRRVSLYDDIRSFFFLVRAIRSFKPHIIHTHTSKAGFLGRIASLVSLQKSIRVHTFHGHLLDGYFGKFKCFLIAMAEKSLGLITDELLSVGDKVREDLLQVGIGNKEKFNLMPPGLSIGALQTKSESRASLGISGESVQCAFIGRVTKIKRPDRFLDVVAEIKKRELDLEFIMVGDGDLLEYCRHRIAKEGLPVSILGWQLDIERILSASDIVILTSDNEGMPLSLIQAGMAALPVVATKVGSVPEVVIDGISGFTSSTNVLEIADALENLFRNVDLRKQMGLAAQVFTLAHFGVNRLVRDHEVLYKKLNTNQATS